MAERDARQRLDLEVGQRRALCGRERAHLLLGERDVLAQLVVDLLGRRGDRRVVDAEALGRPAVEHARVVADRVEPSRSMRDSISETVGWTSSLTAWLYSGACFRYSGIDRCFLVLG